MVKVIALKVFVFWHHAACVQCSWSLKWYRTARVGIYSQYLSHAFECNLLNLKLIPCVAI